MPGAGTCLGGVGVAAEALATALARAPAAVSEPRVTAAVAPRTRRVAWSRAFVRACRRCRLMVVLSPPGRLVHGGTRLLYQPCER